LQNSFTTLSFEHRDLKTECQRTYKALNEGFDGVKEANLESKRHLRKEMDAFRVEISGKHLPQMSDEAYTNSAQAAKEQSERSKNHIESQEKITNQT